MIDTLLIPVLILGGLGLIFGGMLAISSIVFKVEKDERIDKIQELLPGANCGGCGYAGCSSFAAAIVNDGADISCCKIVKSEQAKEIMTIAGAEYKEAERVVAFVKCKGDCNHSKDKYDLYGVDDCYSAYNLGGGPKKCVYGCMGLGSCVQVCKFNAISIVDGIAVVDRQKCTGCGACAKTCPKHIIEIVSESCDYIVACSSKDKGAVTKDACSAGCIGCKICAKKCESEAINVNNNLADIDYEKCTNCGLCYENCPKKIIVKNSIA